MNWRASLKQPICSAPRQTPNGCSPPLTAPSNARVSRLRQKRSARKPALRSKHREAVFQPEFRDDLRHWNETDRKVALRAFDLIEAIMREPFTGIGKPEPLKYLAPGVWSRRLTQEHRLVYLVRDDRIDFLQARYHY
ncbi:MAG: Txe/YoeB family addiction module toxin [Desulfobacteraceae bacterium]|nr:MAG: Txe/YoeB family addiction module toxin [Desulfobacteraceae bacterium]